MFFYLSDSGMTSFLEMLTLYPLSNRGNDGSRKSEHKQEKDVEVLLYEWFIEWLLCPRCCFNGFVSINSFNPNSKTMR